MASPSDFVIGLQVEFDVPEQEFQKLTKNIEKRLKKSTKIDIIDESNVEQAKKAYQSLWKAAALESQKYLNAVETGNTKVQRQALRDIQALQKEITRLYSSAQTPALKGQLTKSVKEERKAYQEIISYHNSLGRQVERSATQQAKLERQKQKEAQETAKVIKQKQQEEDKYIESVDREIDKISRIIYFQEKNAQAVDRLTQQYKNGNLTYEQFREQLDRLRTTQESLSASASSSEKRVEKLNKKFDESKRTTNETKDAYRRLVEQQEQLRAKTNETANTFDKLDKQMKGGWFSDFKAGLKSGLSDIGGMAVGARIASEAFELLVRGVNAAVTEIKELNKVMTDVQMVAGATDEQTMKMFKDYNNLAQDLSVTTKSVAEGASDFLRQGKSQSETMELIRASTVQATLANLDNKVSTELLTSTLNGYKMEAQDAMHVVDALVQVDFKAATSVEELATALQKTANTARISGVDFERLVGYIGSVSEATRQAPELIGRSFRSMFARMQSVAAGKDIDEEGLALNNVEKVLHNVGIELRDTTHAFRSMSDVLDDVHDKWANLTSVQRNQVAESIAGKNQMEIFLALMENYDKALILEQEALNSSGAAMKRYREYQDSIEAKQNDLTNAFEKFVYNESTQELIKSFYELGIAGVKLLDTLSPLIEILASIASGIFKATGAIADFIGAVFTLDGNRLKELFSGDTEKNLIKTNDKISSITKQIKLIEDSDIDINVKQDLLEKLNKELEKANEEIARLKGEQREEGYISSVQLSNVEGDLLDYDLNIKNSVELLNLYEDSLAKVNSQLETTSKKDVYNITVLNKKKAALTQDIKVVQDYILNLGKELTALEKNNVELSENEQAILNLINSNEYLKSSLEELMSAQDEETESANENAEGHEESSNSKDKDNDSTKELKSALEELSSEEDRLNNIVNVVNDALKENAENGEISASTALKLVNVNEDFQKALTFTNGKLKLNTEYLIAQATQAIKTGSANIAAASATSQAWSQATQDAINAAARIQNLNSDYRVGGNTGHHDSVYQQYLNDKYGNVNSDDDYYSYIGSSYRPSSNAFYKQLTELLQKEAIGSIGKWDTSSGGSSSSSSSKDDAYKDALKDKQDLFKAYLDKILDQLNKEKDALEKEKDRWNDYYSEQLKGIEEVSDALDEEAKKEQYLLDIQEKKNNLAKASQTVVRRFRSGKGFVYESDWEAIAAAQDELNASIQAYDEYQKKLDLDKKKQEIEDARDKIIENLDDEIKKLDELANAWKDSLDIADDISKYGNQLDKVEDFEKANYDERLKMLEEFKSKYLDLMNQINRITGSGGGGSGIAVDKNGNIIYGGGLSGIGHGGGGSGVGPIDIVDELKQDISGLDKIDPDIIKYVLGYYGLYKETEMPVGKGNVSDLSQAKWNEIFDWFGITPIGAMPTIKNPGKKPTTGVTIKPPNTGRDDDDDDYSYSGGENKGQDTWVSSGSGDWETEKNFNEAFSSGSEKVTDSGGKFSSGTSSNKDNLQKPGSVEDEYGWYYANGTNFIHSNRIAMVGEEGPELRVLHQGDGIIPTDMTENLMEWGRLRPSDIFNSMMAFENVGMGNNVENYNMQFDSIVLPDVTDFESFKSALLNESRNFAIQIQSERK